MLKNYLKRIILSKNNINIDNYSFVQFALKDSLRGTNKYPIIVKNSKLSGNVKANEGCKFISCLCSGNIKLGRFVSINGPGTRLSSKLCGIKVGSFSSIASNVIIQEDYHR